MTALDAILIGLSYGDADEPVRRQVAEFLATWSAFARGVGQCLARSPGPRMVRTIN